MSPLVIKAIHMTEYFLFAVDLLCFLVYVSVEAWRLLRDILSAGSGRQPVLPNH